MRPQDVLLGGLKTYYRYEAPIHTTDIRALHIHIYVYVMYVYIYIHDISIFLSYMINSDKS